MDSVEYMHHLTGGETVCDVMVGDVVRHYGTKRWGKVLEVVPQRDGTSELRIRPERLPARYLQVLGDHNNIRWWATYHVDRRFHAFGSVEDYAARGVMDFHGWRVELRQLRKRSRGGFFRNLRKEI